MPVNTDFLSAHPFADPSTINVTSRGAYFKYNPNIVQLRDHVTDLDLESVKTLGSSLGSVLIINVAAELTYWVLASGAADGSQLTTSVAPEDYNVNTNFKHWELLSQGSDVLVGNASNLTVDNSLMIGTNARLVALSNGLGLDVRNSGGTWIRQINWQE